MEILKTHLVQVLAAVLLLWLSHARSAVFYVDVNSVNPTPPYSSWSTASTDIQSAIDASSDGDFIWVNDGIYQSGGRAIYGELTNRIAINKAITVQSVNGPNVTVIEGHQIPGTTNGENAVRCVYMTNNAVLEGFTITNGATRLAFGTFNVSPPQWPQELTGGGVWSESTTAIISNCIVAGNSADGAAGGAYSGMFLRCLFLENSADAVYAPGGGAMNSTLETCLLSANSANTGAGAYGCLLNNCTLANNLNGAYNCSLNNCIIYYNQLWNTEFSTLSNCCTTPNPGGPNITNAPLFIDPSHMNFHLQANSPCIEAGNNAFAVDSIDLDGNPRIVGPNVDMGAYEFPAPTYFTVQPQNQSINAGQTVTFNAAATGPLPLAYQWYFDGSSIQGATNASFALLNAAATNDGFYSVMVSNETVVVGSSNAALVVVYPPPGIIFQPTNQVVLVGSNALFSVSATNDINMSYQWLFNGTNLIDGNGIVGSTGPQLAIISVPTSDAGAYQVIVANAFGSVTSSIAALNVLVPSAISLQPVSQTVLSTSNLALTAGAIGTAPLTYQWFFNGFPLQDDGRISGSSSNDLNILNAQTNDSGAYQLVVTNYFSSATSAVAVATVLSQPVVIVLQPTNITAVANNTATFIVAAIGLTDLSYQWYFNNTALSNGGRISGAYSPTLNILNTTTNDSGSYQVIVTNNFGSATSSLAALTVLAPVQVAGQPASEAVLVGSNAIFSVNAVGMPLNYQWYFNGNPLSDGGRISGSSSTELSISNVQNTDAGAYLVTVSNVLNSVTSQAAALTPLTAVSSSTRYVNLNNSAPASPYLDWSTAATNIQDAIDAAVAGDVIVVTNGIYQTGGRVVYGSLTNRVVINKAVTAQSVNGPGVTIINGYQDAKTILADDAIRCVYMTNNATLAGFTLSNGATRTAGDGNQEQSGGALWCESNSGVVSNCIITANVASYQGGGAYQGTLLNCILSGNMVSSSNNSYGGGAYQSYLIGCTISANTNNAGYYSYGGAIFNGSATNCLMALNFCNGRNAAFGGAASIANVVNCVVWSNYCNGFSAEGGGTYGGTIINSALIDNSCNRMLAAGTGYGGGAYNGNLVNCTIVNNYAANGGGWDLFC